MRAAVVTAFGGPQTVRIVQAPRPRPGRGQVRMKVRAAALNPVDLATRAGEMADVGAEPVGPYARLGLGRDPARHRRGR